MSVREGNKGEQVPGVGEEDGYTGARGSAELTKHSPQTGKKSEKRQDMNNPAICAEFNRKWPDFTQFLILETLKYFVWMTYLFIFKDFFDLI